MKQAAHIENKRAEIEKMRLDLETLPHRIDEAEIVLAQMKLEEKRELQQIRETNGREPKGNS